MMSFPKMETSELNERIELLLQSPSNIQEFADIASPEENWRRIDKNLKVPNYIALAAEDCPVCFDTVRMIYDKFANTNDEFELICPHCKAKLKCKLEFTGYTSELILEE